MYLSADCHIMEPEDLFTSQLPEIDKYRAPIYRRLPDGTKMVLANGIPSAVSPEFMRPVLGTDDWEPIEADDIDGYLRDLEADGVWGGLLHPNVGLKIFDIDDTDFALRCARIYNDHVIDLYDKEQFYPTAVVPLNDLGAAVTELRRVASLGFRAIGLPLHAPPAGPYFSSCYEPIWDALDETGLLLTMHVGTGMMRGATSGDAARQNVSFLAPTGSDRWPEGHPDHVGAIVSKRLSTGGFGGYGGQVLDTLPAMIGGGVLERHPSLHIVFVEVGARWLLNMMDTMDDAWYVGPGVREVNRTFFRPDGSRVAQFLPDELNLDWPYPIAPSDYVRRQVHVTFQDDWVALRNRGLTGIEPLMWGNDYPHNEGSFPRSKEAIAIQAERAGLSNAERGAIFGGTLAKLLKIEDLVSAGS